MKKLLIVAGVCAVVAAMAGSAFAATATLTLSPATKSVNVGQTFTVTVGVAPVGGSASTVKAQLQFPANLLEVTGFSFGPTWLPLSQTGYDTTDNTNGVLVKTAGYPGGVSAATTFGTVTFRAKVAGSATVSTSSQSLILDSVNNNLYTGGGQSVVTVGTPAATPSRAPVAVTSASPTVRPTTVARASTTPSLAPSVTPDETASPSETTDLQAAAIFLGLSTRSWGIIGAILVVALILWYSLRRRRSQPMGM